MGNNIWTTIKKLLRKIPFNTYIGLGIFILGLISNERTVAALMILSAIATGIGLLYRTFLSAMKGKFEVCGLLVCIATAGTFLAKFPVQAAGGILLYCIALDVCIFLRNQCLAELAVDEKSKTILMEIRDDNGTVDKKYRKYTAIMRITVLIIGALTTIFALFYFKVVPENWVRKLFMLLMIAASGTLVMMPKDVMIRAIADMAESGIMFKSRSAFQKLANVHTVVLNASDTIDTTSVEIKEVHSDVIENDAMLVLAAYGESFSGNTYADAFIRASGVRVNKGRVNLFKTMNGYGSAFIIGANKVLVGNEHLMQKMEIDFTPVQTNYRVLYIAIDKSYAGYIVFDCYSRESGLNASRQLEKLNVDHLVLFTDSDRADVNISAKTMGAGEVFVLPENYQKIEKMHYLRETQHEGECLAYIGNGITDTELGQCADVAISLGTSYDDSQMEIAIISDDASIVSKAIKRSSKAVYRIKLNGLIFAVLKAIEVILALTGLSVLALPVFLDTAFEIMTIFAFGSMIFTKSKSD